MSDSSNSKIFDRSNQDIYGRVLECKPTATRAESPDRRDFQLGLRKGWMLMFFCSRSLCTQSLFLVEPLHIVAVGAVLFSLQSISDLPGLAILSPSHVQNLMMAMNMQSGNQANQCSFYQCGVRAALTSGPTEHRLRAGTTKHEEIAANLTSSDTFLLMIRSQKRLLMFRYFSFPWLSPLILTIFIQHWQFIQRQLRLNFTFFLVSMSLAHLWWFGYLDTVGSPTTLVKWSPTFSF